MRVHTVHWRSPVAATLILVLLIALVSVVVTTRINEREESAGFQRLTSEAEEFVSVLELNMASDRRQLELIATLASGYMTRGPVSCWTSWPSIPAAGTFSPGWSSCFPGTAC